MSGLLCKRCDVFVGFAAEGVAKRPEGKSPMWLQTHCWICHRSGPEIAEAQGVDRTVPTSDRETRTAPHGDPLALDTLGMPPSRRFLGAFEGGSLSPVGEPETMPVDLPEDGPAVPGGREIEKWPEGRRPVPAVTIERSAGDPRAAEAFADAIEGATFEPVTPIDRYIMSYTGDARGGVTKDVAFNRKSFGDGQPENPDQGQLYVGTDGIEVELIQDFDDRELAKFFSYAINATRGIDPRNPPDETDWEEMMRGGLQTALKRINIAFAVYGASRTSTHQIVRSTRANFHQQSQRAHYYGDRPSVRMPESWLDKAGNEPDWDILADDDSPGPPSLAEEFAALAEHSAAVYRLATDRGVSYQDARFALLEGTTNFILCEYSLDEFLAVYSYRACSMFQWEIVSIMRLMRARLLVAHPWLEPYIKISCEKTKGAVSRSQRANDPGNDHACTFQGWEEVEGQCDFPWAREANRTFRSDRHAIVNSEKKTHEPPSAYKP